MRRSPAGIKLWIRVVAVTALVGGAVGVAAGLALSSRRRPSRPPPAPAPLPRPPSRRFGRLKLWIVPAALVAAATVAIGTAVALALPLPPELRSADQQRDVSVLGLTAYYNARTVSAGPRTGSLGFRLVATQTFVHRPTATATPSPTPEPTATATPRPPFVWPADGPISQAMHAKHPSGIDIAVNTGEPVYAVRDGRVQFAGGDPCCSYGYFMILEHDQGWTSLYAHLSAFGAVAGEEVRQGQLIGLSGESGKAKGAHLHFELRMSGAPVNPIDYLPSQ